MKRQVGTFPGSIIAPKEKKQGLIDRLTIACYTLDRPDAGTHRARHSSCLARSSFQLRILQRFDKPRACSRSGPISSLKSSTRGYEIKTQIFFNTKVIALLAALAFVALALMALPLPRAHAQTGGQGKIEGQITNGTKGALPTSTANLTVTLMTAVQGATTIVTQTTTGDANGKFVFANLDTISTTRYLVMANYADVGYYSDVLAFTSPNSTTLPASITAYDPTDDPSVVQVLETHLVVDVQAPWLVIQQIVVMENGSDHIFIGKAVGPHRVSLTLPILAKAINIQFDDQTVDQTTMRGEGVLTYTLPIGPGKDQILFQYEVPFTPPTYEFNLPLLHDVARFGLYAVDIGETIQSQQLSPTPSPMGDVPNAPKLIAMAGDKFTAGTTIKATIDKLPAAAAQPGQTPSAVLPTALPVSPQTIGLVILGAAVVVAIALLIYPILRKRAADAEDEEYDENDPRQNLLQGIADLDDAFEAGEIAETEYKDKRAALKAKLAEMNE